MKYFAVFVKNDGSKIKVELTYEKFHTLFKHVYSPKDIYFEDKMRASEGREPIVFDSRQVEILEGRLDHDNYEFYNDIEMHVTNYKKKKK